MRISLRAVTIALLILLLIGVTSSVGSYWWYIVEHGRGTLGKGESFWMIGGTLPLLIAWASLAVEGLNSKYVFGNKVPKAIVVQDD